MARRMTNFRSAAIATGNAIDDSAYDTVKKVSDKIEDVSAVNGLLLNDDFITVAGHTTDISAVSSNIAGVAAVAADIDNIDTVSANMSDVNIISSNIDLVEVVAGNVQSTGGIADNLDSINTVSTNISDIKTTSTSIADINTIAADIDNIKTVKDNVEGIANIVTQVIPNMSEILLADDSAVIATDKATIATEAATLASTKADDAVSSADAASTSENNAKNSETSAATSETNASNSETNAINSEAMSQEWASKDEDSEITDNAGMYSALHHSTKAAASANSAAVSEANANDSAIAAANSADFVDDLFLGAKSSAPTEDNDGEALQVGAIYYNTTNDPKQLQVWNGTAWADMTNDITAVSLKGTDTEENIKNLTDMEAEDLWVASDTLDGWVYDGSDWVNIGALQGPQGAQGAQGNGISSITRTDGDGSEGTTDTYTITYTDDSTATFDVVNGADGTNGVTYYTWIKYADDDAGTGMSDDPSDKDYMGIAYNRTTDTESTEAGDYAWSLIKGANGDGSIASVVAGTNIVVDSSDENNPVVSVSDTLAEKAQDVDTSTVYADKTTDATYKLYMDNGEIVMEEL